MELPLLGNGRHGGCSPPREVLQILAGALMLISFNFPSPAVEFLGLGNVGSLLPGIDFALSQSSLSLRERLQKLCSLKTL